MCACMYDQVLLKLQWSAHPALCAVKVIEAWARRHLKKLILPCQLSGEAPKSEFMIMEKLTSIHHTVRGAPILSLHC